MPFNLSGRPGSIIRLRFMYQFNNVVCWGGLFFEHNASCIAKSCPKHRNGCEFFKIQLFVEPHKSFQLFYRTMQNFSHLFGEPEMGPVIKGGGIMILGNQESYFAESLKFHQCVMAPVRFYPAQGLFHLPGRQTLFPARPDPVRAAVIEYSRFGT